MGIFGVFHSWKGVWVWTSLIVKNIQAWPQTVIFSMTRLYCTRVRTDFTWKGFTCFSEKTVSAIRVSSLSGESHLADLAKGLTTAVQCSNPMSKAFWFLCFGWETGKGELWPTTDFLCCAMLFYALLCIVMLCYVLLCYALLCYALLSFVMLCSACLCFAMLCYALLCFAMLRFVLPCYALLCFAMLCYSLL